MASVIQTFRNAVVAANAKMMGAHVPSVVVRGEAGAFRRPLPPPPSVDVLAQAGARALESLKTTS
jgi:hypothetical protein